jgi:type IV pilus assembly protein PilO
MRLTRSNLIVLGIMAAVTVTYVLVVFRGQSSTLEGIQARAAQCRRELESDAAKAAPIPHMVREIEAMKRRFDQDWQRRLPQRQELAAFLREISTNLSQAGLGAHATIEPGKPTHGPLYNQLPITVKLEGGFLALADFLTRVDAMARLTRIEQLKITRMEGSQRLQIEVGMNIYFTEQ